MHVEQSFVILFEQWWVFWKPVEFHIKDVLTIVSAAMWLQNLVIYYGEQRVISGLQTLYAEKSPTAFQVRWQADLTFARNLNNKFAVDKAKLK